MSIQNVNFNDAWKETLNLAQKLNINVSVILQWQNIQGATNAGIKGLFEWKLKIKRTLKKTIKKSK